MNPTGLLRSRGVKKHSYWWTHYANNNVFLSYTLAVVSLVSSSNKKTRKGKVGECLPDESPLALEEVPLDSEFWGFKGNTTLTQRLLNSLYSLFCVGQKKSMRIPESFHRPRKHTDKTSTTHRHHPPAPPTSTPGTVKTSQMQRGM